MVKTLRFALVGALALAATPLFSYVVYLRDGSRLIAREEPVIEGGQALIVLQSGTQTSLAAAEIDVEKTRAANRSNYGSALVLEDGKFTDTPTENQPPKRRRLTDLVHEGEAGPQARTPPRRPESREPQPPRAAVGATVDDLLDMARVPYRNLEVNAEIQGIFRSQGVERAQVYQGTEPDRILLEITTDSEAAVFRALKVAAATLKHLGKKHADIDSFELLFMTSDQLRAGQFHLAADQAETLAGGDADIPAFYIANVRF